ncbi:GNAT family N-acetyltransferase [Paenibacillus sp. CAA11]|uniref:GNAT family N-acetyltransferase n=1 Tax=Paenibacillus sp. CAA11 TaxID=1532905 RepID=UPI000D34354E|nr:GNAT family N-acetyltransferase [Paenibacillus sp. CAA11]AWB43644.1 GNAT family N-acetyltransferase [Paenibacillus sp. CAA11]
MTIICETKRLYLREYKDDDFAALHAIFSDPEHIRFYPAAFSEEQTRKWMVRNQNRYVTDGFGLWAVCLKETGKLIGDCGLIKQRVDGQEEVEIGYHIHPAFGSMGYATEAAACCMAYAFEHLNLQRVISIIAPGNEASIRVAEKAGLRFEKTEIIFNREHLIYACNN